MRTDTNQTDLAFEGMLTISGRTTPARHASASGARKASKDRPLLAVAYVELLRRVGPMSDHEAAKALGREVSSINSTRNGLGNKIVPSGVFEATTWGTKRVCWRVRKQTK